MSTGTLTALVSRFNSSGAGAGITGGIWVTQAPPQTSLPLCILVHGGETPQWTFENVYVDEGKFTFVLYGNGLANVEDLATQIKASFDWCSLNITGGTTVKVERTGYRAACEEQPDKDGELVFRAEIDYVTQVTRTY